MTTTSDLRDEIHTHIERINREHHPQRRSPGRCSCWGPWPCLEAAVADALHRTLRYLEDGTLGQVADLPTDRPVLFESVPAEETRP